MRIAYVCSHRWLSTARADGSATHMREVIRVMRESGHEVLELIGESALAGGTSRSLVESSLQRLKPAAPSWVRETGRRWVDVRFDRAFARSAFDALARFEPTVIYERSSYLGAAGIRLARKLDLPLVLEVNSPFPEEADGFSLFKPLGAWIERRKWKRATRFVTISAALQRFITSKGVENKNISVIPNGANLGAFDPTTAEPEMVRARYGLRGKIVLGYSGSFFMWHAEGLRSLVEATAELRSRWPLLHVLIVGAGSRTPAEIVGQQVDPSYVTFTGNVAGPEVKHYLAAFDIATVPHNAWYASPIKLFEYGAMGKPIVAADTGPIREVMENGKDGQLVRPNDPPDLMRGIEHLLANPEIAAAQALRFQKKVRSQHDWDDLGRRVLDVCSSAIEEHRRRSAIRSR